MKKIPFFFILFTIAIFFSSCFSRTETLKPKVSGKAGELLLVMPERNWISEPGSTFREILTTDKNGLPQPEPLFSLIHVIPDQFAKIFNSHRNIILVSIGPENEKNKISVQQDLWSTPQIVINIKAESDEACKELLNKNSDYLIDRINRAEQERVLMNYRKFMEAGIVQSIKMKHHINLVIPKGYRLDVDSTNFVWLASETPTSSQGILIYFFPYTDENTFTPEYLVEKRDMFLKKYVPGPSPNTWMATEDLLPPGFKEFELDGKYYSELRGLWKLQNGFMGGPFVSLSTVDELRNRVVTVEGFVYAPGEKKRELLRQVESILFTLTIDEPED